MVRGSGLLMDSNALILMPLRRNHNVCFVQHKYRNFLDIENSILGAPIENFSRRANDDVLADLFTTTNWKQFTVQNSWNTFKNSPATHTIFTTDSKPNFDGAKLSHFSRHFTGLDGQLISWRQAQHLRVFFWGVHAAQHGQNKCSGFPRTGLTLRNHILGGVSQECWQCRFLSRNKFKD